MKQTTLLIATILLLAGTLSAQEFAVAKVTCVEPIVGPTILAARVTGSPFEGAHELRVSPKQCPTAQLPTDNLSGWSVSQAWVNQLSQVDADWEVGLSTRGDSAEVNARIADLFEAIAKIR